ncbi:MAG: family 10 glycosylhydrolase [Candidatus Sumerlaeia bacterium]|nr:family 10 glycosylhydrolase [Candidatus Sumerlaeia bacterium]
MKKLLSLLTAFLVAGCIFGGKANADTITELRGIWLRPPSDISLIPQALDEISTAGFNAIFVETFYHGHTIFPSEYVPQRPEFKGTDVLAIYIEEAKKRGLQVHSWIETFYWEVDTTKYPQFPRTRLFEGREDWKARLRDGSTTDKAEFAHIFANPAHPEVQQLLINFITEIVNKYEVAGINMDYIRYSSGEQDAGYDEYSRARFKEVWGIDPKEIDKDKHPALWHKWVQWRENQVTHFLQKLRTSLNKTQRKVLLTADVFPDYYSGNEATIFQDWRTWIDLKLIDAIIPMAYSMSLESIQHQLERVKTYIKDKDVLLFAGLAASKKTADRYGGPGRQPLSEQIKLTRQLGLRGHIVFCYDWMKENEIELKSMPQTVYQTPASAYFVK